MTRNSLIAAAISALAAAPAARAVDFEIGERTSFSLGGTLEPSYESVKDASGDSQSEFTDNDSTLQLDGEHRWNEHTTGFFHIEYEWNLDENDSGIDDLDSAWIGMRSGFGTVRVGTSDPLYEDSIPELLDRFENAELDNERYADQGTGEGDQLRYVSPDFGGFSVAAEVKIQGDGEDEFVDSSTGVADGPDADEEAVGLAAVGRYDTDWWGVVAGMDDRGAAAIDIDGDDDLDRFVDETTAGIGGYADIAAFHVAARYAAESNPGSNNDRAFAGVLGSWDYGSGSVNLAAQDISPDRGRSRTQIAANVMHDVFENLRVFVEVGRFDNPNERGDRTEIGAIYGF